MKCNHNQIWPGRLNFAFLLVVARLVTGAVVVIQFLFTVFTGRTNENLRYFGASLAQFIFQTLLFVTYNSDTKPFPFSEWPENEVDEFVAEQNDVKEDLVSESNVLEEKKDSE